MSSSNTLTALESFCTNSTGNSSKWIGNNGQYQWNLGRASKDGNVNGVVRKLAGIDALGKEIWVVAGSIKITPAGEILRFTGMTKAHQKMIAVIQIDTSEVTINIVDTVNV